MYLLRLVRIFLSRLCTGVRHPYYWRREATASSKGREPRIFRRCPWFPIFFLYFLNQHKRWLIIFCYQKLKVPVQSYCVGTPDRWCRWVHSSACAPILFPESFFWSTVLIGTVLHVFCIVMSVEFKNEVQLTNLN